jgi:MOSC domain-containing protein YiiM
MFQGELVGIFLVEHKADDLQPVDRIEAIPGRGLVGDRYFLQQGSFSNKPGPDREVTLIEMEALDALYRECDIRLQPSQARRNLVTRGVPLNHLVGKDFTVGTVVLHGIRLCEPCGHLEKLTYSGVNKGLCHRGGLRANIVEGGILRPGDRIQPRTV